MNPPITHLDLRARSRAAHARRPSWSAVFDALPAAVVILGGDARVLARNPAAAALLGPLAEPGAGCCELLGCRRPGGGLEDGCVARLAVARGEAAEVRVELADGTPAWLAAAPVGPGGEVVILLRPLAHPSEDQPAALVETATDAGILRVLTLGSTRLEVGGRPLAGEWLGHRPGLVLKYLACERGRAVPMEELLDVLWPAAGRSQSANVRQAIHSLRDRLEPGRTRGVPSGFVLARRGGYELAPERVWIDAEDFEARARAGLQAARRGEPDRARAALAEAADAYGGDFLADEPYADWALAARERLRDLAAQVLRGLAGLDRAAGDLEAAGAHLLRLAELEPLDLHVQRDLIALMLERGRHSEALRRFEIVRARYKRAFGEEPGFGLAELTAR